MPRAYRACLSCLVGLVLAACGGSTDPDDTGTIETTSVSATISQAKALPDQ